MNEVIRAIVSIDRVMQLQMSSEEIEDYVKHSLEKMLSKEITKYMSMSDEYDILTDTMKYTGSLNVASKAYTSSSSIVNTTSGFNGTTITRAENNGVHKNLRVVEYTKNNKTTRVELQYFDGDDWHAITRVKKEDV